VKTNIGIETTDEERLSIGNTLGLGRMATRKEIRETVNEHVQALIEGRRSVLEVEHEAEDRTGEIVGEAARPLPEGTERVRNFMPSRGDEAYLFTPRDPELKQLHSNLLDAIEALEEYTWKQLEKNRQN